MCGATASKKQDEICLSCECITADRICWSRDIRAADLSSAFCLPWQYWRSCRRVGNMIERFHCVSKKPSLLIQTDSIRAVFTELKATLDFILQRIISILLHPQGILP